MSVPTKAEISAAVEDNERAVFDFASAYSDGTLGLLEPSEAADLARRASESVKVASNAFGVDAQEGDTPDALMGRMLGVYAAAAADVAAEQDRADQDELEASMRARTRSAIRSYLGLTDADLGRMDFDMANGDPSPWLLAKERYVFG